MVVAIYNYDFSISALCAEIIFIGFFLGRRKLPIRQNKIFLTALFVQLVVTVADIASSHMDNYYYRYEVWQLYLVNMAYFISYAARACVFFQYAMTVTYSTNQNVSQWTGRLITAPFAVYCLMIFLAPLTSFTFHIERGFGYQRGWGYEALYVLFFFYLGATMLTVLMHCRKMSRDHLVSFAWYFVLLIIGNCFRIRYPYVLSMDAFSQMAIIIIFLSLQNPDFYIDKNTSLFDVDAFYAVTHEWNVLDKSFCCYCFYIDQYDDMRNIYDVTVMNDTLHTIGRWMQQNRGHDTVFYFGDGRFVATGSSSEALEDFIMRVEERFQKPWKINIGEVRMGLRSGLMTEEVVSKCPMQLRELLYFYFSEDFNENKSHIVLNEELLERMQRARNVEKALDRAIKNDSIQVWYQPIYSYKNKCFDTAEALVRLEDEELGRIMPGEFIERAEKTGQIILLGRQIFRKVCAFISDNDLKSMGINYIHVNLSPIQCMNEMLVKEFSSDMKLYNTKPSMIAFEISETATIETEEFQTNLRQLAHIGKGLALDDYGSGATNLNRMVQWHINMVKIDKNIVSSFFEKGDITVITDLVNMFHNQNLLVVAEGIETKEMTEMAEAAKVDLAQGYYYSKPLPEHEYIQFLKDHTV